MRTPGFAALPIAAFALACVVARVAGAATPAACDLEPGPLGSISLTFESPEAWTSFAWRIPRSSCAACAPAQALEVESVSVRVRWLYACSAQAEVLVVAAKGDPACPVPDTSRVLCGPVTSTIAGSGPGGVVHTLPLPGGCCVSEDAFALVRFVGLASCGGGISPGLTYASGPCVPCSQYVTIGSLLPAPADFCAYAPPHDPLWMSVSAGCCAATPAGRRSWGSLKTVYR